MKITYYVHDLSFPLVEGVRKQAWWMALEMKKRGHPVEIVTTSSKKGMEIREGIPIRYGNPLSISSVNTGVMHYISHPSPLILPLLIRTKARTRIMTFFDGGLNGFWKRSWYSFLSKVILRKIDIITLQTNYQQRLMTNTKLRQIPRKIIPPLFPKYIKRKLLKPNQNNFNLLFMSHLSQSKGILDVLRSFEIVRARIKGIQLILCDSGIRKNSKIRTLIQKLNRDDILIKGKVNPEEELAKATVYLYPVREAQETFSVPLSLIEASQMGTPYLSTTVGGIPEYFPKKALVPPSHPALLAEKIISVIKSNPNQNRRVFETKYSHPERNNQKVIEQFIKIYEGKA